MVPGHLSRLAIRACPYPSLRASCVPALPSPYLFEGQTEAIYLFSGLVHLYPAPGHVHDRVPYLVLGLVRLYRGLDLHGCDLYHDQRRHQRLRYPQHSHCHRRSRGHPLVQTSHHRDPYPCTVVVDCAAQWVRLEEEEKQAAWAKLEALEQASAVGKPAEETKHYIPRGPVGPNGTPPPKGRGGPPRRPPRNPPRKGGPRGIGATGFVDGSDENVCMGEVCRGVPRS